MNNLNKKGGISILGLIVLAVLVIFALNYFHLNIKIVPDSSMNSSNQSSPGEVVKSIWNTFLAKPLQDIWNSFILPFISSLKNGSYAQPNTIPQVNYGQ
jgi:hypothetical protein